METPFVTERTEISEIRKYLLVHDLPNPSDRETLDRMKIRLKELLGKGHVEGQQVYEQRVRRIWRKAMTDGRPLPEPYGVKPRQLGGFAVEYNFPTKYDIDTQPLYSLECMVR